MQIKDQEDNEDTNVINIWQMDLYDNEDCPEVAKEVCVPLVNQNELVFGPQKARGRTPQNS